MFRLLIPAWEPNRVDTEPLLFPQVLEPFRIKGMTCGGSHLWRWMGRMRGKVGFWEEWAFWLGEAVGAVVVVDSP